MLVQFEKEIDREIAEEANNGAGDGDAGNDDDDDDDDEDDEDDAALVEYGPHAQIVTNDLRSLDEMVSFFEFFLFVFFLSFFFQHFHCPFL